MNAPNVPQLPDYLQNRPYKPVDDQLSGSLGAGSPPYLSIMGGRFTLVDAAGNESHVNTVANGIPYIDVVVIDSLERQSKIYYGANRTFDPNNFAPPVCFSDNGVAPSRGASQPQSATCASCEKGAWGSAVSKVDPNRKTKACADYQKLALLVPPNEGVYLLRVPPNSLRPLREYTARFRGTGTDISDVITRITFERDILGTLIFTGVSYIDQQVAAKRNEIRQKALTDTIVGRLDQPITALAAPTQGQQLGINPDRPQDAGMGARPFPSPQTPPLAGLPDQSAPTAGFQLTGTAPLTQPTMAAPPAQAASPSKRGRPKRSTNGQQAVETAPGQAPIPPFPTASNPAGAPAPQFGITPGQAPDDKLNQTLNNFFGPTK